MKKKIHVQHVVLSLQPGGLENGVVNVVNRLCADQFESSICCLKQGGEFVARIKPGVAIHEMGWRGGNDPWLLFRLARLFRTTRPDVIHTRNVESFYYSFVGARLAGVKCVVHSEHGRTFDDRPLRFYVQRWLSAHTQAIFAVSEQLKRDLVTYVGIPDPRIQVLYNGVDLDRFIAGGRDVARRQLCLSDADLVIGSVGRLAPVKNYSLLLRAVAALDRDDVTVILVGDGPERTTLEAQAASVGIAHRTRFLGHRDDVISLLTAMDIFVLPSISEGMSNTLLEAMAAGVPCVVSDAGGNPEIVRSGRDGFLFPNGDQAALATHLGQLADAPDLRRRFAQAGRERVVNDFSLRSMVARYEDLYRTTFTSIVRWA